jgi:hypothetical protein
VLVVGFDLDMTLVDSRPGIAETLRILEAETGAPVATDEMLVALLRRTLDLEFGDRFDAQLDLHREPERLAQVGDERLVDRARVDGLPEQRSHDVLVGGEPGLHVVQVERAGGAVAGGERA